MKAGILLVAIIALANARVCNARMLPLYWSESTTAKVVVDGVGDPVPGVIVVAAWMFAGLEGAPGPVVEITETVTDEQGEFYIPGWGPRVAWPPWETFEDLDPQLLLFKPGYKLRVLKNRDPQMSEPRMQEIVRANKHKEAGGWGDPEYVRRSYWNGKAISMTREQIAWGDLDEVYGALGFAFHGYPCGWKRVPRLLAAMLDTAAKVEFRDSLGSSADGHALMVKMLVGPSKPEECGSIEAFLRGQP